MLTPTHLVAGQSAYLAVCAASGNPPAISESVVALAAAMLPDLDARQSYIGRLIPPLSTWIGTRFGHRTLTHSLAAQVVVLAFAWWLIPTGYFIALAAGWISHSIADMMTRSGVCWFWPSLARCVLPGNPRYRMEVLGRGELWFLLVMVGFGLVMMPLAQRAEGTTGLIRSAIGDIGNARKDFDADKGRLRFAITIRGRDNISYADISGTYRVISLARGRLPDCHTDRPAIGVPRHRLRLVRRPCRPDAGRGSYHHLVLAQCRGRDRRCSSGSARPAHSRRDLLARDLHRARVQGGAADRADLR
jgi:inner membrane protein